MGDGPLRERLRAAAAEHGVRLELVPSVDHRELPRIYADADVFVLPSFTEGHSKVLIEAMSCGLPCVASDIVANRSVLAGGDAGLLFDPRTPQGRQNYPGASRLRPWREHRGVDQDGVALEGGERLAVAVPQPRCVVPRGGQDAAAVRREHRALDPARVALEGSQSHTGPPIRLGPPPPLIKIVTHGDFTSGPAALRRTSLSA